MENTQPQDINVHIYICSSYRKDTTQTSAVLYQPALQISGTKCIGTTPDLKQWPVMDCAFTQHHWASFIHLQSPGTGLNPPSAAVSRRAAHGIRALPALLSVL